jgi:hypothetical protein
MTISFANHQLPSAINRHPVWLYVCFTLSYRDLEDLLVGAAGCLVRNGSARGVRAIVHPRTLQPATATIDKLSSYGTAKCENRIVGA